MARLFIGETELSVLVGTICALLAVLDWQKPIQHLIFARAENRVVYTEGWRWMSHRILAECRLDEIDHVDLLKHVEPETERVAYCLKFIMADGKLSKIPKVKVEEADREITLNVINEWLVRKF